MTISRSAAVAVALILAATPSLHAGEKLAGEKLSAEEIADLFPGRYEAIWKNKHQVQVVAGLDGEISGSFGIFSGSGEWSIVGDELCVDSRWFSGKRPKCSEVTRQEGWYLGMVNSKGVPRVRFRPKDTE